MNDRNIFGGAVPVFRSGEGTILNIVHLVEVAHALLVLDLSDDLHLRRDDDAAHTDRNHAL